MLNLPKGNAPYISGLVVMIAQLDTTTKDWNTVTTSMAAVGFKAEVFVVMGKKSRRGTFFIVVGFS
jgi:hypothetical protein